MISYAEHVLTLPRASRRFPSEVPQGAGREGKGMISCMRVGLEIGLFIIHAHIHTSLYDGLGRRKKGGDKDKTDKDKTRQKRARWCLHANYRVVSHVQYIKH